MEGAHGSSETGRACRWRKLTRISAGSVRGAKAAVGVRGAVSLALDEGLAIVLHLNVSLRRVEGEEVVDDHARHAWAHLVGAEWLEPVRSAGCAMVHTPVLERKRDCSTMPNTLSPHTIARDTAQSACRRRRGGQQRRGPHCQRHFPPAGSLPWSDFVLTHVGSSRSAADMPCFLRYCSPKATGQICQTGGMWRRNTVPNNRTHAAHLVSHGTDEAHGTVLVHHPTHSTLGLASQRGGPAGRTPGHASGLAQNSQHAFRPVLREQRKGGEMYPRECDD